MSKRIKKRYRVGVSVVIPKYLRELPNFLPGSWNKIKSYLIDLIATIKLDYREITYHDSDNPVTPEMIKNEKILKYEGFIINLYY